MKICFLCCISLFIIFRAAAQDEQQRTSVSDSARQGIKIITKIPFNGINYFITIVPIDSTKIDNMPMYNPNNRSGRIFFWNDSLQHMFPDSLLKLLPKSLDLLRQK